MLTPDSPAAVPVRRDSVTMVAQGSGTGLPWVVAAFFLVTDMSIGGMLPLPGAIFRAQFYAGLLLLGLFALLTGCSAVLLGKCWQIVVRRHPECRRTHCRKPYAEIGYRAFGHRMRTAVSVCVNCTQFGASTVFLLLCANNIRQLWVREVSVCPVLVAVALLLLPVTLLKSPNDFWPVLFGGMFCTVATFALICVGTLADWAQGLADGEKHSLDQLPPFDAGAYSSAVGTILFAYGGHPAIPTVQHDMKQPSAFGRSAILAFTIITAFNAVVVGLACSAYGGGLTESVVASLRVGWIRQAVVVLATANSLLSVALVINPLNQEAEELLNVPQEFGWKRVLVRSAVLASIVFVAESVPTFGPVLDLVGGSTVTMTSVVFPWLFHLALAGDDLEQARGRNSPLTLKQVWKRRTKTAIFFYTLVIVFASLAGILATLRALRELALTSFAMPCYLRPFLNRTL